MQFSKEVSAAVLVVPVASVSELLSKSLFWKNFNYLKGGAFEFRLFNVSELKTFSLKDFELLSLIQSALLL